MIWQRDHMVRRIYLTDKHSESVKPSWFGESIGHHESDGTLVVDTIGLSAQKAGFLSGRQQPGSAGTQVRGHWPEEVPATRNEVSTRRRGKEQRPHRSRHIYPRAVSLYFCELPPSRSPLSALSIIAVSGHIEFRHLLKASSPRQWPFSVVPGRAACGGVDPQGTNNAGSPGPAFMIYTGRHSLHRIICRTSG
jgi:hypothetical protein